MKTKTLLFIILLGFIGSHSKIYAQNYGPELLTHNNFGTIDDGVTGVNTTQLYDLPSWITPPDSLYSQPPTRAYYNNWTVGSTNPPAQSISINPAVTIAPSLQSTQTAYTFGFNETWYSNYYTFLEKNGSNSNVQIPMAPNNGNYVIATSTQGMYNAPTLAANAAAWYLVYDRYEVNQAKPTNYFLIVNSDQNQNKVFYQETVAVTPGHIYRMSADLVRLNKGAGDPNVAFFIGGVHVFDTGVLADNEGQWETYAFDYVAPCNAASTIPIAFSNNTTVTNGNDLALDNLSLKEILPQITTETTGTCPDVTVTLNAVIELANKGNYTIHWYSTTNPALPNISTDTQLPTTGLLSSTAASIEITTSGSYYYTLAETSGGTNTTACPLYSPVITIADAGSNCPAITPIVAYNDRIQSNPGLVVTYNIVTANDCNTDVPEGDAACSSDNLQILQFVIPTGYGYDLSAGTYTPGTPIVITDNAKNTIGVLTLATDGTLTFQEVVDYTGSVGAIHFYYTIVNSQNGATASTYVDISLKELDYTIESSCVGYPIRVIFDVEAFLAEDFYYSTEATTPSTPIPPGPGGLIPVGQIDPSLDGYINDAVATRYYLVCSNTLHEYSDQTILNDIATYGSSTTKIGVIRTDNPADGGKIIFEYIANTPGLLSYQFRKKDVYAKPLYPKPGDTSGSVQDPILRTFLGQICPQSATWNGSNSDVWSDNSNWYSDGLGAYPTWCTDVTITSPHKTILDSLGNAMLFTIANYPMLTSEDACRDIVFSPKASVGSIQNLTYRAAFVQYQPPYPENSEGNYEGKWTMISAPLKHIYSADFQSDPVWGANAFTDIKSYMSYFDLAYSSGKPNPDDSIGTLTVAGSFSRPFANLQQELSAGFGFASNVIFTNRGGTTFTRDSTFYFPRFTPYGNAKNFQDLATHLFEVQYKYHYTDDGEWINSYPNPAYNPFTLPRGTVSNKITDTAWSNYYYNSTISYLDTQHDLYNTDPLPNPLSGEDSRYRFAYEESAYSYSVGTGQFTLPISGSGATRIVGNPLMSHLDFDVFASVNSGTIQPYYRLWDGTSFYAYVVSPNSYDNSVWLGMDDLSTNPDDVTSIAYRYIPPMQAFFVDVKSGVPDNGLMLDFDTLMSTAVPNANIVGDIIGDGSLLPINNELRAKRTTNENLLKLRLKMKGVETIALLASLPKASDRYDSKEDIYKLFSYNNATPEIYTVSDKTAIEINAVSQEGTQKLIPIGIKTNQTGKFELSIEGVDDFNAYEKVFLRDALEDKNYDLKESSSFSFNKTSQENLEGRFYILLGSEGVSMEAITVLDNQEISIVSENTAIRVYSPIVAIESFEVYDISGRLLFKDTKIGTSTYLWNPRLEQDIYIVNVRAGKYNKVQKIKW